MKVYKLIKWYPSLPTGWKDEKVMMVHYCGNYHRKDISAGIPYSEEDIEHTMKVNNLSREEVMKRLQSVGE